MRFAVHLAAATVDSLEEHTMLFRKNTVTGTVRNFNRGDDGSLSVTIERSAGTLTLLVYGELADRLELVIFQGRERKQAITVTLEYDPRSGRVVSFDAWQ